MTGNLRIRSWFPLARGSGLGSPEHVLPAELRQVIGGLHRCSGPGSGGDDLTDQTAVGQFVWYETEDEGDEHLDQGV
jgi:hypothetical protein